jgi:hypothetical protein
MAKVCPCFHMVCYYLSMVMEITFFLTLKWMHLLFACSSLLSYYKVLHWNSIIVFIWPVINFLKVMEITLILLWNECTCYFACSSLSSIAFE